MLVHGSAVENMTVPVTLALPTLLPTGALLTVERLGFVWAVNATDRGRVFPLRCPVAELVQKGGCWVADPLLPLLENGTMLFLPAGMTASLWVTFYAPAADHNPTASNRASDSAGRSERLGRKGRAERRGTGAAGS